MNPLRDLLLDTNAFSALLDARKGETHRDAQAAFLAWLRRSAEQGVTDTVTLPVVVLYEVRRGLLASGNKRLLRELERFVRTYAWVEEVDETIGEIAAVVWARCRRAGVAPGDIDPIIFATGVLHESDLVTSDRDFDRLEALKKHGVDPSVSDLDWGKVRLLRWADLLAELEKGRGGVR